MGNELILQEFIFGNDFKVNISLSFYKVRDLDIIFSITVKEEKYKSPDNTWFQQEHTRKYRTAATAFEIYSYLKDFYKSLKDLGDNDIRTVRKRHKLKEESRRKQWTE